jgi:PPP family 3-phenylpropionic acid transporter
MMTTDGLPYWRLSGFYFLFFLTLGALMPYWAPYLKSLGMNAEEIGILSAITVFNKIFSSFIWGWIVDHTGKRIQMIRMTSLLSVVSFVFVLLYQDFWSLFIILFIFSIFWSAALPQIEAITLSHLGEKSDSYTKVRLWGSVGFIISVVLLGKLFEQKPIFCLVPIVIFSMTLVWLNSLSIPEIKTKLYQPVKATFKSVLLKPHIISLLIVCFLVQAGHGPYYTFFSIYLEEHNYSSSFIGIAWAVGVIAEVLVYIFIHRVISRFQLRWLMMLTLILGTIRWLSTAYFVDNLLILIFTQCLHAATFGVYHAVAIQYIHREFKGEHQGRGQALYSSVSFGAGLAFGTLMSGYLWSRFGSMEIFLFSALMSASAMVIGFIWLKEEEREELD